ncbi:MAG TPA: family 1 encapsulin nanocompartment shell protein [Solirubrobacteraceae bacterium]|jgi:uncharacterized linocin/CFP29 family protein
MNHLLRSHAPISEKGWEQIDEEARQRLAPALAARKLVDFSGPLGWEHSATSLGRAKTLPGSPAAGASARQREVLPLIELRADFAVLREELRSIDRGAVDADFDSLDAAAHQIAIAENAAVLQGWPNALQGIAEASPYQPRALREAPESYASLISAAMSELLARGIDGPYGLALDPHHHRLVTQTVEQGGPLLEEHLRTILRGPIVWTPGIEGGLIVSLRGGDYLFESGQDLSVGYDSHDGEQVNLYIEESFSFRVATPEAAVVLAP